MVASSSPRKKLIGIVFELFLDLQPKEKGYMKENGKNFFYLLFRGLLRKDIRDLPIKAKTIRNNE